MRRLFDNFSSHYDSTMLEKLQYRAHLHVRDLAARTLPSLAPGKRILSISAWVPASSARRLGISLWEEKTRRHRFEPAHDPSRESARGIYDDLILGDVETVLNEPGETYDLVLAADTMIYIGDLGTVFSGVAKRLAADGFYIFAVEGKDGEGWEQTPEHRFRHSDAYVREAAIKAGFAVVEIAPCTLRMEFGVPVAGFVVAMNKANRSRLKQPLHSVRLTIICFTSAMASAGFRPLGQVLAQFMMVWQR